MLRRKGYNFENRHLKRRIEHHLYSLAFNAIGPQKRISIVSGPECVAHYSNAEDVFGADIVIDNYEINRKFYEDIYNKSRLKENAYVHLKSIEYAHERFIDCDLTCQSDMPVHERTLDNQIRHNNLGYKAFIFTICARGSQKFDAARFVNRIFQMLGSGTQRAIGSDIMWRDEEYRLPPDKHRTNGHSCLRQKLTFDIPEMGRIKSYECIYYDAGGGNMLTCLVVYK